MLIKNSIKLTVLYENPFWVGIFERSSNAGYAVARVVFGDEPTDPEVYDFVLARDSQLRFTAPSKENKIDTKKKNPKRVQREIRKEKSKSNLVSKAQDALRIELEKNKKIRKKQHKIEKEEREARLFQLKQEKRKKKKRGH